MGTLRRDPPSALRSEPRRDRLARPPRRARLARRTLRRGRAPHPGDGPLGPRPRARRLSLHGAPSQVRHAHRRRRRRAMDRLDARALPRRDSPARRLPRRALRRRDGALGDVRGHRRGADPRRLHRAGRRRGPASGDRRGRRGAGDGARAEGEVHREGLRGGGRPLRRPRLGAGVHRGRRAALPRRGALPRCRGAAARRAPGLARQGRAPLDGGRRLRAVEAAGPRRGARAGRRAGARGEEGAQGDEGEGRRRGARGGDGRGRAHGLRAAQLRGRGAGAARPQARREGPQQEARGAAPGTDRSGRLRVRVLRPVARERGLERSFGGPLPRGVPLRGGASARRHRAFVDELSRLPGLCSKAAEPPPTCATASTATASWWPRCR